MDILKGLMRIITSIRKSVVLTVLLATAFTLLMSSHAFASDVSHDRYYAKLSIPQPFTGDESGSFIDQKKPSAGDFLIATRKLKGSFFSEAVILLNRHGMHGTIGLVINRVSEFRLSRALPEIAEFRNTEYRLYAGGPVEAHGITALIRSDAPPAKALHILDDIYAVSDLGTMKALVASNEGMVNIRFYHGYAAWASGQLEDEILRGSWKLVGGRADTVFREDYSGVWRGLVE